MTAGTLVPAAEGSRWRKQRQKKAALPAGAGASLEGQDDTEATEAMDGDRSQLEEAEAAATQVHLPSKWSLGGLVFSGTSAG